MQHEIIEGATATIHTEIEARRLSMIENVSSNLINIE